MVTGIDTHVYTVKDFDRALTFYKALFEAEPATSMDGGWAEFVFDDGSAFAIGKHENFPWQVGNTVMFAVPDVPTAVELVRSLGGSAEEPGESPVCYMSFAEDTEGNKLVLHRRK
jgi:predicted enzyme related to lactoylglutathione lyase